MIFGDEVPFNITCFKGGETSSPAMARSIETALLDVQKLHR
jgi:hypothetical protein